MNNMLVVSTNSKHFLREAHLKVELVALQNPSTPENVMFKRDQSHDHRNNHSSVV